MIKEKIKKEINKNSVISFSKYMEIILFDEATSSLDIDSERRVMNNIKDVYRDKTIIFVSHRLANIKDADQILVLHNGSIGEQGKHEELLQLNGRYKTLYQQQGESINV